MSSSSNDSVSRVERKLIVVIYFFAVVALVTRLVSWFAWADVLGIAYRVVFVFVLVPLAIIWCALNIRIAQRTNNVIVHLGLFDLAAQKQAQPTLYALYLGAYWMAAIMFIFFWIGFVTGIVPLH